MPEVTLEATQEATQEVALEVPLEVTPDAKKELLSLLGTRQETIRIFLVSCG